jgi:hypothetical protein
MPTVSLNAFLKILTKGSPQKAVEYGRYLAPGGYDFYWLLKDAARDLTIGGKSLEDCSKVIEKINRPVEKKHNLSALKSLDAWLKKREIHEFFEAPSSSYVSPAGHITIKIEPAFGYVKDGHQHIVHAWNSQTLALPNKVASCGLYLMQQKLCVDAFADCIAGILDTRKREHFYGRAVPMIIPAMIASELAWADSFFENVAKAA